MGIPLRYSAVMALAGFGAWAQSAAPVIAGVYSEGSTLSGPIAPGMLAMVTGSNLAASTVMCNATTPLPFACNGVSVLVNGKAAPVAITYFSEIDFQVPYGLTGTSATIQVTNQVGGLTLESAPVTVAVAAIAPFIFIAGGGSSGVGVFQYNPTTPITPSNPARPGDTVTAYGDGFGVTNPAVADGANPESPAPVAAKVSVTVGGRTQPCWAHSF